MFQVLAFVLTLVGALSVFLSSPNQRLRATPGVRPLLAVAGLAMILAGGSLWRLAAGFDLTATIFVTLTVVMLAWLVLPYGDAGLRIWRSRHGPHAPERR